jgi:glycosyltransferase involved in cell wall biosynthesis
VSAGALRIAVVAPVATTVPPPRSGSIEALTSYLVEGLVARGHDVTLFAVGGSTTSARLHATFPHGYRDDPSLWTWELCEMMNVGAAVERASSFDVIHVQCEYWPMSLPFTRLVATPVLHTVHYSPRPEEVDMWRRYPEAAFVAVSAEQARRLDGLHVVATVHHAIDTDAYAFRAVADDYLLFLGRFTKGKGARQAIGVARRAGLRLLLAAEENDYYREFVAPLVDGDRIRYVGEVSGADKVALLGGARALLYPVQLPEPFGLVLAEAMACGTPAAALDVGAVREIVDDGVTGGVFATEEALVEGLPRVLALDRRRVRDAAVTRFGLDRMVDGYQAVYRRMARTAGAARA